MCIHVMPCVEHVIVGLYMDTNIACRQCMQLLAYISAQMKNICNVYSPAQGSLSGHLFYLPFKVERNETTAVNA